MMSNPKALPRISFRHYERLRFLHNSVKKYDTESSFEMSMDENDRLNNIMRPNEDSMEKNKLDSADVCFRKILDIKSKEYNLDELDEDKLFCLTLSREFKKVPETRRLKLKAEIYNLILFNQLSESQQHDKLLNSKSVSNMPTNAVADSSMGTSTEVTEPNGMVFGKTIFQNCNEMENFKGNRKYKRSESSHEKSRLSFVSIFSLYGYLYHEFFHENY